MRSNFLLRLDQVLYARVLSDDGPVFLVFLIQYFWVLEMLD